MKTRHTVSPVAVLCAAVSMFCFAAAARGATYTWDASGNGAPYDGSGTWSLSGSNWSGSGGTLGTWQDQQTDMAVFGANSGPAGTVTVSNYGNAIYSGSMTFNPAGSGTYLITGDPIDLGGSSGTATIVVNASSGTIGSLLETYNNSLIMSGKGALYLTNAVYAGTTKISGSGELYLDCPAATTAIAVTAGTLGGSGGASGAAVTVSTKAGIEAGSGGLGTLTLGGLNFNGTSAEIKISNVTNYAGTPAIVVINNNGLVADGGPGLDSFVLGGPAPSGSGTVELMQYTGTVGGSGTAAFGLNFGGLTGLSSRAVLGLTTSSQGGYNYLDLTYKTDYPVWTGAGNGIWVTSPNLTVSGTTNWVSGFAGTTTNFIVNDAVVFNDSATGTTNVSISGTGNVSPGSVTFNNNNLNYTLSSTAGYGITGNASLTMNGSGSVTISNSNGYSGGTIVNAGALYINNAGALGSGTLTINGGTIATAAGPITLAGNNPLAWNGGFTFAGSSALNLGTGSVTLGNSAAVTLVNTAALTIGGPIADNGTGFTQNGAGLLVLTGSSSYSGPTNVNGGTLSVGNGGGGASIAGTSGVNLGVNTTLLFNHSNSMTFTAPINGSGSVVQSGGSLLSLANSYNSYTGSTTVSGGTLQAGNAAALGNTSGLSIAAGGVFDLNGNSLAIPSLAGAGIIDNISAGGTPTLTIGGNGANATFSGTIQNTSGALTLVKAGAGVQTLSGTSTFSGGTQITGGTLNVAAPLALQQSTVNVSANNSLTFGVSAATLGQLSGSGNINLGPTNLTAGANGSSSFYSGSIGGAGGLTKTGSGTLTLLNASSYSGATHISGGVLQVLQVTSTPPTTLPVTAGLQYWLDASNPASVSATTVTSWNDLSGNGYNFTVASSGAAPTLVSNVLNGLSMVQFDGATTVLANGNTSNVNAQTVFAVTIPSTAQTGILQGLWGNYGGDGGIRLGDVAGTWRGNPNSTGDSTDTNDFTYNGTTYLTTAGSFDANSTNFGSLGTPQIIVATSTVGANYATTGIGGYFDGVTGGRDYAGDVGEVLVYNTQLSTAQRQQVESYLDYKWLGVVATSTSGAYNALPTTTPVTISNGGTFDMTGGTQTIASLSSTDGVGSQVLLGGGVLTIAGSATTTFDGVISGAGGSLVKQGGGKLLLTGNNTYTGNTIVSAGTLQLGDGASKAGSVAGNIVNSSAVIFAPPASQVQIYTGAISGSGSLAMNGPGVLQLTASHSYTGPTVINGGLLRLSQPGVTVSGFGSNTTGTGFTSPITNGTWTFNSYSYDAGFNDTPVTNNTLDLTDGSVGGGTGAGCARTGFYDTPVPVNTSFVVTFTYNPGSTGSNYGTGMSFILTSSSNINSVSGAGRGFGVGYCPEGVDGEFGGGNPISPSVNLDFDMYGGTNSNYGNPPGAATGYNTNGGTATLDSIFGGSSYAPGDPINMTVGYNATTQVLSWSGIDVGNGMTFSQSETGVNLTNLTGGTSALIGFGGGATYFTSYQTISNFSYQQITGGGTNILPATTALSIASGGTLDLNAAVQTVGALSGAAGSVITDESSAAGATPFFVNQSTNTTFAGSFQTGPQGQMVSLYLQGTGMLTLSQSDTLSAVNVQNTATLVVGGSLTAEAIDIVNGAALAGNGSIVLRSGADGLDYASSASSTFAGTISGPNTGGLKVDGGTLVLSGTNTFAGGTVVDDSGTLILTNDEALADGSNLIVGNAGAFAPLVAAANGEPLSSAGPVSPVPEPATLLLFAAGALAAGAGVRLRGRTRRARVGAARK